jgi:alpha-beta hydrolase superfamily lysophospholipase
MRHLAPLLAAAVLVAGCITAPTQPSATPRVAQVCPAGLPDGTRCYGGEDGRGAFYAIAIPPQWNNGTLVVHAHGGPDLVPANPKRVADDLERWAIAVKAGHAWIGTSYRRGGYGWTEAGEDVERAREIFLQNFGSPRRTILHGQSYGGGVAAKLAESLAARQAHPYDAMLLTDGMLGGGTRYLEFRFDLRVVYQYVCRNHPRSDEPQYPLWKGLPGDSRMNLAELTARVDECTGARTPEAQRTEQQRANLANIVNVIHIRPDSLVRHMEQATWLFRDLTQLRLGGRNPFDNAGVIYRGSSDDNALNAGVQRYVADPLAVHALAQDSEPEGKLDIPVLTLHAIDDPTAFVELESAYRDVLQRAGHGGQLVQVFTDEHEHSYLSDPEYAAAFTALQDWMDRGEKPTPQKLLVLCQADEAKFGNGCHIRPEYQPAPLTSRVASRPAP